MLITDIKYNLQLPSLSAQTLVKVHLTEKKAKQTDFLFQPMKSNVSLIFMHGQMCLWECIVFSPVSSDGREGENKLSLFASALFFVFFVSVFVNMTRPVELEEAVSLELQL